MSLRVVLLLALVATGAWAETDLEQQAGQIIEGFRAIMPTGRPDIGIPVLDPAVIKQLPITIKLSPFDAKCVASDINVAGVSGFKFTKLSQLEGTTKLAVAVELPDIQVNGQYDLNGKVKIGFIHVKLGGHGPLELSLKGLKGEATADVLVNEDGTLSLNDLILDTWSYNKISVQLDNLLGGGVMGKTVNSLINKLVPTFIKSNRAKINQLVQTMGKKVINQYLDGINGKKHSFYLSAPAHHIHIHEESWVVSDEVQDILEQLALAAVGNKRIQSSSPLADQVSELLEDFRGMMTTGLPDLGIPVLDPAVIHRLPVEIKLAPLDAEAVATEVSTAGVSKFIIHKLEQIQGATNQLFFDIEVPEVDVSGQYEINGTISLGFMDVDLSGGKGPVTLTMKGFKGTATAEMLINEDGTLNLNWLRFDSWNFDDVKAELGNVFMGEYVNLLINKLIPPFLKLNQWWINNWGQNVATEVVNRYLDGIAGRTPVSISKATLSSSSSFVISPEIQDILDRLARIVVLAARH